MYGRPLDDLQESAWNKQHADFLWNVIEYQGECLVWRVRRKHYIPDGIKKRGTVKGFSRSSRLRLIRSFARTDWKNNMPILYVTLTYPDEVLLRDRWIEQSKEEKLSENQYKDLSYLYMTQHRWVFWRYLEKYLGKQIGGVWRIEYKERLSGNLEGKIMPHLHMLIFNTDYIPWQEIRWRWQNTIGERFVNVDVRACYDVELILTYLAKYLGKDDLPTLEYDAYLDSLPPGRCWGWMRKNLVAKGDKWAGRFFETDDIASLRLYAIPEKTDLIDAGMCSFTLIGERAIEVGQILFGKKVDGEIVDV